MNSSRFVCCCTLFVLAVTLLVETVAAQSEPMVHTNQRRVFQSVQEAPAAVTQGNPARQRQPYGFTAPVTYGSGGNGPDAIAMADLNGDGKLDVAVADLYSNSLGVLLGNGDGTLQSAVSYDPGCQTPLSLAIKDLNGDGHPDLVVTCQFPSGGGSGDSVVSVLLGNGDGTLRAPVSYDSGGYYSPSVVIADLNGDGHPDLVVASECASSGCAPDGVVSVLLGNGDGTFQFPVNYDSGAFSARSVAVGDVNGDGILDLVVSNQGTCQTCSTSSVGVLLGNGDGTFRASSIYDSGPAESFSVAIGDLNGDGYPDLAVSTECGIRFCLGGANVLMGNGDGTFQPPVTYDTGAGAGELVIADVTGDGFPDILMASGMVALLPANPDGTFQAAILYRSDGVSSQMSVADLNRDGRLDVVTAGVAVLLNDFMTKTKVAVTSSPNPSQVNQTVTFTATVTYGGYLPDGSPVTFLHGKTILGVGKTIKDVATFTTAFSKANKYSIKASYAGDAYHSGSSSTLKQVVNR